ncbi:hypothetical protein [Jannaschia donghaensis]|uniref:SnoaL-like domain-containing protein n=1 Tax=Jannaschia donghaensis TaxID=420998 RepID=A0A0M6YKT9_9RHOB|nr:hypothetical protein [Jannaschia donghaensis]CTQ50429.1 hypothetical protein JDO7802_02453 [Jannaschia donghaensis]
MQDARDIYQAHLDLVSRALWDRDYETIIAVNRFPHIIRFSDGNRQYDGPDDFAVMAARFRDHLDGLGATGYHRVCEHASFDPLDRHRITGGHWTYILRGGNYLTDPYNCEMVLVHEGAEWMIADIVVPPLRHGIPSAKAHPENREGQIQ